MLRTIRQVIGFGLITMLLPLTANAAPATIIPVTTVNDTATNDGECSLREAIQAANSDSAVDTCPAGSPEDDTISFVIPGVGPHTIQLTSLLPSITTLLSIDGYTQEGAQPNSNSINQGLNSVLKIILDGSQIDSQSPTQGLSLTG